MIRYLVSVAVFVGLAITTSGPILAGDVPSYSRPDGAKEVLRAKDLPFQLWYDADKWDLGPQRSQLALLARAVHKEGNVSGAFVYREQPASIDEIQDRAVGELEAAFKSHEVEGFSRRKVNGLDIMFLKASAVTKDGTEVIVRNYYWQGPNGVADYGLVANRSMYERYSSDMLDLLNGLKLRDEGTSDENAQESESGS